MSEEITIIEELIGKTFHTVKKDENVEVIDSYNYHSSGENLIFRNEEKAYCFYHEQDCCEDVRIEDIIGDLSDLEGSPILVAEEYTKKEEPDDWEHVTYTFYKFSTIKGSVTVRWFGTSNGCYSESVSFDECK